MQKKNCKHLFSYRRYIFLQENVCLTLLPKNAHGITQGPTLLVCCNILTCYAHNMRHVQIFLLIKLFQYQVLLMLAIV